MSNGYINYILSRCNRRSIRQTCGIFKTKEELVEALNDSDFVNIILCDKDVIQSIVSFLCMDNVFDYDCFSMEYRIVYDRCYDGMCDYRRQCIENKQVDYEQLFDRLVDMCWLLSSYEYCSTNDSTDLKLVDDPTTGIKHLRIALHKVFEAANTEKEECNYIADAIEARKSIKSAFTGKYTIHYEESKKYLSRENYPYQSDLDNLMDRHQRTRVQKMIVFYILTLTALVAEETRRQFS